MYFKTFYLTIITSLIFILSCAVNPVTGKREFMLLSEADEIKLGQQSDPSIVQMYGVYDDKELHGYLDDLGQKMVQKSHRPNLKFEFKLMDSPVINAFAVPGGYVYITRGIMAYLNNEAELAGVVGHEIGHVTARHSAKQYSNAQVAQLGLGLGAVLAPEFTDFIGLAAQGVGLLFLKFSRDHERESDDLGVEYSTRIGYDAREMSNFFHTLDQMSGTGEGSGLPDWFSTHPNPADRVVDVRTKAEEWRKKVDTASLKVNRDEYLNRINGLVYGENPRQGFVENNVFYHPDLKFQFPVPAGWKLTNLPSQVQILSADERGAIMFAMAPAATSGEALASFQKATNAQIIQQGEKQVNGHKALRVTSTLAGKTGPLSILSYFIEKDKNIYVFHGFTKEPFYPEFDDIFESTMSGFATLRDRAKLAVQPERIRIQKLGREMTLEQALKQFNMPQDRLSDLALLNGMTLTDRIPANSLIKTIDK